MGTLIKKVNYRFELKMRRNIIILHLLFYEISPIEEMTFKHPESYLLILF